MNFVIKVIYYKNYICTVWYKTSWVLATLIWPRFTLTQRDWITFARLNYTQEKQLL